MDVVQIGQRLPASDVERDFGQPGHAVGDGLQRRLLGAVELNQALHGQLAQHPQG
jgi:hypothetical protein